MFCFVGYFLGLCCWILLILLFIFIIILDSLAAACAKEKMTGLVEVFSKFPTFTSPSQLVEVLTFSLFFDFIITFHNTNTNS